MIRRALIPVLLLVLAVVLAGATGPGIGKPAPDFALPDLDGKTVKLADFRDKVLVLQWFNAECPFTARIFRDGTVRSTLEAMKGMGKDHVYVAVNSTAVKPAAELVESSRRFLEEFKLEVPVLIDADGAIGKRYDARTTPQVFIVDHGVLRYGGAFTDNPWGGNDATTNYVLQALNRIAAGEAVEPEFVRPWGCSVKYDEKQQQ